MHTGSGRAEPRPPVARGRGRGSPGVRLGPPRTGTTSSPARARATADARAACGRAGAILEAHKSLSGRWITPRKPRILANSLVEDGRTVRGDRAPRAGGRPHPRRRPVRNRSSTPHHPGQALCCRDQARRREPLRGAERAGARDSREAARSFRACFDTREMLTEAEESISARGPCDPPVPMSPRTSVPGVDTGGEIVPSSLTTYHRPGVVLPGAGRLRRGRGMARPRRAYRRGDDGEMSIWARSRASAAAFCTSFSAVDAHEAEAPLSGRAGRPGSPQGDGRSAAAASTSRPGPGPAGRGAGPLCAAPLFREAMDGKLARARVTLPGVSEAEAAAFLRDNDATIGRDPYLSSLRLRSAPVGGCGLVSRRPGTPRPT